jgi:hypothetical protein
MSEPNTAPTPRVSTPLTAEQANTLLKLHHAFLAAKVTRMEASEAELKAVQAVNEAINKIPRPDSGNWEINLEAGTIDPK